MIRGHADAAALAVACHDDSLHRALAPSGGDARAVFEAVEQARVEAVGAHLMEGVAANLKARMEQRYARSRITEETERAEAPLADALALLVRERLTGLAPPAKARAMVNLWRPWIEEPLPAPCSTACPTRCSTRRPSAGSRATCSPPSISPTNSTRTRRTTSRSRTASSDPNAAENQEDSDRGSGPRRARDRVAAPNRTTRREETPRTTRRTARPTSSTATPRRPKPAPALRALAPEPLGSR